MKHPEYEIQKAVCKYLELQYKDCLFYSDTVASVKLTMGQAVRNKAIQKTGFKLPDLIILKPMNGYAGLMIELKTESPYYKGQYEELKSNDHIKAQSKDLVYLNLEGYMAAFAWSFSMAKGIIDYYMNEIKEGGEVIVPHTPRFYELFDI
jgi:hypothetical protein